MQAAKANRVNERIRITPIRVIDQNNEQMGVLPTHEALQIARDAGLDLVEVSPTANPPVCRIMDYGKHKYDQAKKNRKQTSSEQVLKELRLRPKTDDHDRMIKMKRAKSFLESGHKVQFTMLFRGRERSHQNLALDRFNQIVEDLGELVKVERAARVDGRRMTMVLAPAKKV